MNARPRPGEAAYDPASGRTGMVQPIHYADELLFDHQATGHRVAFLRPPAGGVEWTADAETLRLPPYEPPSTAVAARGTG